MDFFKKRIKKYQEKKLEESLSKIKFHVDTKKQLEQSIEDVTDSEKSKVKEKITYHSKMAYIWQNNVEKIKKEIKKLEINCKKSG